jgi:hypothetical protein
VPEKGGTVPHGDGGAVIPLLTARQRTSDLAERTVAGRFEPGRAMFPRNTLIRPFLDNF